VISLLYFAWVRERIGVGEEQVEPGPATVAALLDMLVTRSPGHAAALVDRAAIRVAVDQNFVGFDAPVHDGSEVAIFPPVTGG
jgi:molybdopterin synthase sulfur carrier subunit